MRTINLTNDKKRDAEVCMETERRPPSVKRVMADGSDFASVKVLKQNLALAFDSLKRQYDDLDQMGQAIIDADPEIDMEVIGRRISGTRKLYIGADGAIAYRVNLVQVIKDPAGNQIEQRDLTKAVSNVTGESVVQWSGRKFPKHETIRKFVFQRKLQIKHVSGLTFDFLYAMAKDLEESNSLMFVGGGKRGNEPLVLTQGGEPYRGFLEGRTSGDKYCLILHLTNLEVKAVES